MATEGPAASLLGRRIVIVTGKGGTGKTTVSAALALAAAERGMQVLAAEVGPFEHLPVLLADSTRGRPPEKVGYAGRTLRPGLHVMRIDPFESVAEYMSMQVGSRRLVERVLRNRALKQLMAGAPGWRELVMLGKTSHLEEMRLPSGEPRYDLIVIDAPATGHGLTFLDVPHVVRSAVESGPLARNAERVEALMRDPERTLVLPVSLAEELPTQETAELVARVQGDLGMTLDRVVVNAVAPPPPGADPARLRSVLESLPGAIGLGHVPEPQVLARCVEHLDSRHRLNARYVEEIEARTGLPTLRLPLMPRGVQDVDALRRLAEPLLAEPIHSAQDPAGSSAPGVRP
jgi:anion-transporting  ArsA/GET3 family ATPase